MKKLLFFSYLILITSTSFSQNWNCFVPGIRQYFTNGNGYLRGMRIDSVKTIGSTTVYYPFHTARGMNSMYATFDSTGGSWLGKNVLRLNDGTFLFDNMFGDTVIIKTQATIGDSWILYNDTTHRYYKADLTIIDTMTIDGTLDSVKRIAITSHNDTGIVSADSLNGFEILLSKNHGFVEIFDMYTFPYHKPDSTFNYTNIDYYLSNSLSNEPYSFSAYPGKTNEQFTQIPIVNPTYQKLYNWHIGDVLEYGYCYDGTGCAYAYGATIYDTYTIVSKNISATKTTYGYSGEEDEFSPYPLPIHYDGHPVKGFFIDTAVLLIDTVLMPEEYKQDSFYYYYPGDTSYCYIGILYKKYNNLLRGITPPNYFEPHGYSNTYKTGLGLLDHQSYDAGSLAHGYRTLLYVNLNGSPCHDYVSPPLGVDKVNNTPGIENSINIYPNPATNEISVLVPSTNNSVYTINIVNMMGQIVYTATLTDNKTTIQVGSLPSGVYNIQLQCENGGHINQKLVIVH